MTPASFSRRLALLATLASSLWLAACGGGGGGGNGSANLRAINLTTDLPSADLYTGDNKQFSALTTDTLASNVSLEATTYTINVKTAGDTGSALFTGSYSLSRDQNYTAIVWGRKAALRVSTIGESEDTANIADKNTRIRAFNATLDSGTVDVYVIPADTDPSTVTATQSGLTSGSLAGFREITARNYRILVVGTGNPSDVRLDIPDIALAEKTFYTLVVTQAGSGGVLMNGTLIAQQGARTTAKNTKSRIRLAASVANSGSVTAKAGTTTLRTNYLSPNVSISSGGYITLDAGAAVPLLIGINGTQVPNTGTMALDAGSDYTLLVSGSAAAPKFVLLPDDNRLPATSSFAKIRLVNGLSGTALLKATVSGASNAETTDTPAGAASPYVGVLAAGSVSVEVNSSEAFLPLFTESVTVSGQSLLTAQGVYTVFVLDGSTSPVGRRAKDR